MFAHMPPEDKRPNLRKLLLAYGCDKMDLAAMTTEELQNHLYEHQFETISGEWPEDP
jgi:hypothetical protein